MVQLSKLVSDSVAGARNVSLSTIEEIGKAASNVGKAVLVRPTQKILLLGHHSHPRPRRRGHSTKGGGLTTGSSDTAGSGNGHLDRGGSADFSLEEWTRLRAENAWLRARVLQLERSLQEKEEDLIKQRKLAGGLSRLRARNITVGKKLGEGGFGAVYRGQWRGVTCALKFVQQSVADSLIKEFSIMDQFDHANIVQLYGIVEPETDGKVPSAWPPGLKPPCLVMEYMGYQLPADDDCTPVKVGTFIDYLHHTKLHRDNPEYWIGLCGMLAGGGRGLSYLHSYGVLHRDIKGVNLLLDGRGTLKLADFGLATQFVKELKDLGSSTYKRGPMTKFLSSSLLAGGLTMAAGTYTHMAPEVMSQGNYNVAADVFSFGIVISEAIAGCEAEDIVDDTRTRDFGLDCHKIKNLYCCSESAMVCRIMDKLIELAGWCCNLDPTKRPTTDQILGRLQRIQLEYQAKHLKATSPAPSTTASSSTKASNQSMHAPCSPTSGSISDAAVFLMSPVPVERAPMPNARSLLDNIPILSEDDEEEGDNEGESSLVSDDDDDDEVGSDKVAEPVDPRIEEAATKIFEMVDRNKDGYLHYEETQLLAKLSEDYDLSPDAYI